MLLSKSKSQSILYFNKKSLLPFKRKKKKEKNVPYCALKLASVFLKTPLV